MAATPASPESSVAHSPGDVEKTAAAEPQAAEPVLTEPEVTEPEVTEPEAGANIPAVEEDSNWVDGDDEAPTTSTLNDDIAPATAIPAASDPARDRPLTDDVQEEPEPAITADPATAEPPAAPSIAGEESETNWDDEDANWPD
jgi:hypothetical protein